MKPALLVLALSFLLAGCSTPLGFENDPQPEYYKKDYRSDSVTEEEFVAGGLALAGIVLRDGVDLARTPDLPPRNAPFDHAIQTGTFSPTFEWKYAQKTMKPPLLRFREFDDIVPDDLLVETWRDYAQGGYLAPELLHRIHSLGPGVRFIVLVRVEYDHVVKDVRGGVSTGTYLSGMKSGPGAETTTTGTNVRSITLERKVGFNMGVFDLEQGICVWEDRTMKELHRAIDPEVLGKYEGHEVVNKEDGVYDIVEFEDISGAPAFTRALEDGLETLFSKLKIDRKAAPSGIVRIDEEDDLF